MNRFHLIILACMGSYAQMHCSLLSSTHLPLYACIGPRTTIRSLLSVAELKGALGATAPEFIDKNPVVGAAMPRVIANICEFGPEDSALYALCADPKFGLFFMKNGAVYTTRHLSFPGSSLTPELIAELIAYTQTEEQSLRNSTSVKWRAAHSDDIERKHGLRGTLKKERLDGFFDALIESKREAQRGVWPLYYPYGILTYALTLNAEHKIDIVQYLKHLHQLLGSSRGTHTKFRRLATQKYSLSELQSTPRLLDSSTAVEQVLDNTQLLEQHIASHTYFQNNAPSLPEQVKEHHLGFKTQYAVADCVEAALRDVCNILLADKHTFNMQLLPPSLKLHPNFVAFYHKYSDFMDINNIATAQAWKNLLSAQPSLIYVQPEHELMPNAYNLLEALNLLFGTKCKSWNELGLNLSTEASSVQMSLKDITTIAIDIENHLIGKKVTAELCVEPDNHAELRVSQRAIPSQDLNIKTRTHLLQAACQGQETQALMLLATLSNKTRADRMEKLNIPRAHTHHLLLSSALSEKTLHQTLMRICQSPDLTNYDYAHMCTELAKNMINEPDEQSQHTPMFSATLNENLFIQQLLKTYGAAEPLITSGD